MDSCGSASIPCSATRSSRWPARFAPAVNDASTCAACALVNAGGSVPADELLPQPAAAAATASRQDASDRAVTARAGMEPPDEDDGPVQRESSQSDHAVTV